MANTSLSSTEAQSQLIDKLFDARSAIPPLLHCRQCGTELLHAECHVFHACRQGVDRTGAPLSTVQSQRRDDKGHPRGRYAIGLKSRGSNRSGGAKDKEKVPT